MLEWMIMPYKRYFDFKGRSRRKEYWSFVLLGAIIYLVCGGLMVAGGFSPLALADPGAAAEAMAEPSAMFYLGLGVLGLFGLVTIIPGVMVIIRRLHDRDMSGWWYLGVILASLIPIVGMLAGIAFLVLMFLPGTAGPNRFGPDPKDPSSAGVFS
jgi:uncharacterized membrane protein YhaH (DUF805 family)